MLRFKCIIEYHFGLELPLNRLWRLEMSATGTKRRRWSWLPWVALAIVLGMMAYQRKVQSTTSRGALPGGVEITKTVIGTQQQKIASTGVIASQIGTQVRIGSQIAGTIRSLPADVGSHVKAHQIVAILDLPDIQAQVEQQRHVVASNEAALAQARSLYQQAVEGYGLSTTQTKAQIDQADATLRAAIAKVDSSSAAATQQPTQTKADIDRANAALSSAKSAEKQVEQTVDLQVLQAQANIDDAQATLDTNRRTLARQQALLAKGYIAADVVDQTDAVVKQGVAKLQNMKAAFAITKEKNRDDLQAAHDQVKQAEAALAAAEAEKLLDVGHQADLRNAQETARQAQAGLALQQAGTRQDRIKKMAIEQAYGAVVQAEANVRQARAQLKYENDQFDKTVIRSPIDGTVLSITSQQGETVSAGFSVTTLITVADLNRLEVRAYIDETDIGHIRLGLPAEIRVEAFPNKVFRGNVTKIASASTIKDNVVTYETTIALKSTEGLLRPDMTADVSVILGERPNVILVPSEAVHREVKRSIVYVLHPEKTDADRVEVREVKPGFDDGTNTEIRSGLKLGESVVVAGLPRLGVRAPDAQGGPGR